MTTRIYREYSKGGGKVTVVILLAAIIAAGSVWLFIQQAREYAEVREAEIVAPGTSTVTLPEDDRGSNTIDIATSSTATSSVLSTTSSDLILVTIYFNSGEHAVDCGDTVALKRNIPKTLSVADATLRILFDEDIAMKSLKQQYIGVTVKDGRAVVNFKKAALEELDGAACQQQAVKTPIEKTLMQFPTIKFIDYAIDGVIKTDWDA